TISGVTAGDRIEIKGVTIDSTSYSGTTLTLNTSGGTYTFTNLILANGVEPNGAIGTNSFEGNNYGYVALACFLRGTLIDTPTGMVAVEELAIGDMVATAAGEPKPIKWIGR